MTKSGDNSPNVSKKQSKSKDKTALSDKERVDSEEKKSRSNSDKPPESKVLPLNLTEWVYEFLHTRYGM